MRRIRGLAPDQMSAELAAMCDLVVLLQGAIVMANIERWALQYGEHSPPKSVESYIRTSAYEVTVVDAFHRIARRHFERYGYVGIWERALYTGLPGRPKAIDISLFNKEDKLETRVELGYYTKTKLREDVVKLYAERDEHLPAGYSLEFNLLALWEFASVRTTARYIDEQRERFEKDAEQHSNSKYEIELLSVSAVDLFAAEPDCDSSVTVGLFVVKDALPAAGPLISIEP